MRGSGFSKVVEDAPFIDAFVYDGCSKTICHHFEPIRKKSHAVYGISMIFKARYMRVKDQMAAIFQ
jgi:hypothetical protein